MIKLSNKEVALFFEYSKNVIGQSVIRNGVHVAEEMLLHSCDDLDSFIKGKFAACLNSDETAIFPVKPQSFRYVMLFQKYIGIFHPISKKDVIDSLVESHRFLEAIHLCQMEKLTNILLHVANEYACHLWESENQHMQAIRVWAEYIFPIASKDYWEEFCERLAKNGKLHLIEDFLPFDNKNLLSPKLYFSILEHYLKEKKYSAFHERIIRWPLVYSAKKMVERVLQELDEAGPHPVDLLHSLFKLCDFQNEFLDAFKVLIQLDTKDAADYFIANNIATLIDDLDCDESRKLFQIFNEKDPERASKLFPEMVHAEDLSRI